MSFGLFRTRSLSKFLHEKPHFCTMAELLKEQINKSFLSKLSDAIQMAQPSFDRKLFFNALPEETWHVLELKQRIRAVSLALNQCLTLPYQEQIDVLLKSCNEFSGLPALVFPDFVEVFGLEDFESSIEALEKFTVLCTAEFAIRFFLIKDYERTFYQMKKWAQSENLHHRRLASEGMRTKLPWAIKVPILYEKNEDILGILELVRHDDSEYVRRSVANNLNDLSKDFPEVVLQVLSQWNKEQKTDKKMIKHALRSLLKSGNMAALNLVGVQKVSYIIRGIRQNQTELRLNETYEFSFTLLNNGVTEEFFRLEYKIGFVKASGSYSYKVFKIGEYRLRGNEEKLIVRRHAFKDLTTRKHYGGKHSISLIVNGEEMESHFVELIL